MAKSIRLMVKNTRYIESVIEVDTEQMFLARIYCCEVKG